MLSHRKTLKYVRQKSWKFLATRPLGRIFIFVNSSFKLFDLKLFHGLRTSRGTLLALKSFHKEYPSFQPVQEHLLPSFLAPLLSLLCPHPPCVPISTFLPFYSRYQFSVSSGFFISIVVCYFAFLEMCITDRK